ncbi:hypothetical protein L0U85_09560 [Glycomyces sp. L485]|uniref:hypothetical protein n=1 Tax=Glycomyces sp. L485 TaxID=2909235 RepID=UPI001F4BC23A|nr:hypothetical protein [Glycomyces sp. L485]MCH7231097.1 hypothetical protein [Glycomyces sp. L485]
MRLLRRLEGGVEARVIDDVSEGFADPKVKELVEEYREYLKTACGRLYTAGEQIKAAAEAYASEEIAEPLSTRSWRTGTKVQL